MNNDDTLFNSPVATYNTAIVCIGNSCRSIIMHSLFEHLNITNHQYFSFGVKVKESSIMKNTKEVLLKNGISACKNVPQSFKDLQYTGYFDRLIILDKDISLRDLVGVEYKELIRLDIYDPEYEDKDFYQKTFDELLLELNKIIK